MNETVYQEALVVFTKTLDDAEAENAGKQMRASGRANAKEDKKWWLANGPKMIHSYAVWREQNPDLLLWDVNGVPAIELEINVDIAPGVRMKAFIDRIFVDRSTGSLLIVDLKSGKNTPPSALQLATYRTVLEDQFDVSPQYGAYWMARTGTLDAIHDLDKYPTSLVRQWFSDMRHMVENNSFIPRVSRDCGWCGVRDFCYLQNPALKPPKFLTERNTTENEVSND